MAAIKKIVQKDADSTTTEYDLGAKAENVILADGTTAETAITAATNTATNKMDKPVAAVIGNLAAFDGNKNVVDTGKKVTDFDASGKMDKPTTATANMLAMFDKNKNLVDSVIAIGVPSETGWDGGQLIRKDIIMGTDSPSSTRHARIALDTTNCSAYANHTEPNKIALVMVRNPNDAHPIQSIMQANGLKWNMGKNSLLCGNPVTANGAFSIAFGLSVAADGDFSIAVGRDGVSANGEASAAFGGASWAHGSSSFAAAGGRATGRRSVSFGGTATKNGSFSACSIFNNSNGIDSATFGKETVADNYQLVCGRRHNGTSTSTDENAAQQDLFIVGGGDGGSRARAFRVRSDGNVFGLAAFNATGADFAEYYEWRDGNPGAEDRAGLFVAIDGEKVYVADENTDLDDVLGIYSALPSIVGDAWEDNWNGMFLKDEFGRIKYETVVKPEHTDDDGVIHAEETVKYPIMNPDYDENTPYLPRSERKEWDAIGTKGKLAMIDDGTCQVNKYCKPGKGGIATHSDEKTLYRVMSRVDDTHIRVLIK